MQDRRSSSGHGSSSPPPPGESGSAVAARVAGRFGLQRLLGRGASGRVYRAHDEARDAAVAIKFLTAVDPASLFRFKSEFRTLQNLTHPNLLQLYELLTHDDDWLLVMELVEGTDFLSYVRPPSRAADAESMESPTGVLSGDQTVAGFRTGSRTGASSTAAASPPLGAPAPDAFDETRLRGAFAQLCEGLHALHRAQRLHRDLKPANVLVSTADERVVICDFGLVLESPEGSAPTSDPPAASSALAAPSGSGRRRSEIAGTLAFMSPEQALGRPLTPASDWWAVGAMLYQALTGRLPFNRLLTYQSALRAKLGRPPPSPLELVPGAPRELAQLAMSLLAADPARRAGYAQALAALRGDSARASRHPRVRAAFVGRDEQLRQLTSAFEASRGGTATMAILAGASGMGKSQLARHFLARVERDAGALVLRGRCYEREELPYKALDPLMDALSTHLLELDPDVARELLPGSVRYLSALFPALRRVPAVAGLGEPDASIADPRERRRLAFAAFRELCRQLARRQPLVLFIDDLQWGDRDSAPLFGELLSPPSPPPLLVLCAHRSEDEQRSPLLSMLREARAHGGLDLPIVEVQVSALAIDDAVALARTMLEGKPDAQRIAERIAREAEGSPFFVHELCGYAAEHGVEAAGKVRLDALIAHKLAALPAPSREVLSVIALAGRPVSHATVQVASGLGPALLKALRELAARRLVSTSRWGAEERIECQHDRIREAATQLLGEDQARAIHRALAEAVSREPVEDCEALFKHWRGAGEPARAREYALRGAQNAERALAFARAADLYRAAIALLPPNDARTRGLQERLGHALILAGRGPEAAAVFRALVPGASAAQALTYRMLATTQLLRGGKLDEGFAELARADDLFGVRFPASEARAMAMLLHRKARIHLAEQRIVLGDRDRAKDASGARLEALWEVAAALTTADFLRGSVYGAELMLRALAVEDPSHIAGACGLEAVSAAAANRPRRVERMMALALEAGRRSERVDIQARVKGMQAICRQLQGRWLESVSLARESQALQQRTARVDWDRAIMVWWELASASQAGLVGELAAKVPDALRDAEARGDVYAATSFRTYRMSWAWLALDRPDEAERHVAIAEREWTPRGYQFQHWHMTYARSEVDLYRGTPQRSLARLQREWGRSRLVRAVRAVGADMLYTRARLALAVAASNRRPDPCKLAEADGRALIALRMPWTMALGKLVQGAAAALRDPREAMQRLAEAETELAAADMRMHAAAAKARRGALIGGGHGQALREAALAEARALGARRPEAFVQLLVP